MLATLLAALLSASPVPSSSARPIAGIASPCPTATPSTVRGASPVPCASPALKTIGVTAGIGRKANLVGIAQSASTGTINQEQIAARPLLRPGEILEEIPGLDVTQHSGGGKANQYYLRGFQLDHGTDLDGNINGIPINLGSHAHGQGYSDINYLIPELVGYVEFKKGVYFADQGDFATAGGYDLFYRNTIAPTTSFTVGDFGYDRFLTANATPVGNGNLLYAVEISHDNGSYIKPDEYQKFNGVLRYSRVSARDSMAITAIGYSGTFGSTDQIPQRLIDAGDLKYYGTIDPTDGGNTYRYAISGQFTHQDPNGETKLNMYGVDSYLNLFSNFTYDFFDAQDYYNVTQNPITCNGAYKSCTPNAGTAAAPRTTSYQSFCPANNTAPAGAGFHTVSLTAYTFACGDQREQKDVRTYYGFDLTRSFVTPGSETVLGVGLRDDDIPTVLLALTNGRVAYPNGTLSNDHITLFAPDAYVESTLRFGAKLRMTPALRFDSLAQTVAAYLPANSGRASEGIVDPKFTLAYAPSKNQEAYFDIGESYHSNDARGVIGIGNVDPQTHAAFDATGADVPFNAPLTRAFGDEIGYRYSVPRLTATFSAFRLLLENELVFDGDHGTTSVGGPTERKGVEFANYWTALPWLTLKADLATTTARFTTDPLNQGTGVPESLNGVVGLGATAEEKYYTASVTMQYFGPRTLDTQGDAKSPPTTAFNTQYTARLAHRRSLTLDVFNIFNAYAPDVTYSYASWTIQDAANPALANNAAINPALGGQGVTDYHLHPQQKRTVRVTFAQAGI
jgi:hypothetical protein